MNFPFRVTQKVCQNENRSLTVNTFFIYLSNKTTINIPILLKYKIIQIIIYFENNLFKLLFEVNIGQYSYCFIH